MPTERQLQEALRERSFREIFPWRNVVRAAAMVLLIVAVIMLKKRVDSLIKATMGMLSPSTPSSSSSPSVPATSHAARGGL